MFRLPFLENTTPPPFYLSHLSEQERTELDRWFIGHRSQAYYLRRFGEFDKVGKLHARWHWSAFFTTFGWLMYRKRYLDCMVYCIAGWSFIKLNVVIILAVSEFLFVEGLPDGQQMYTRIGIAGVVWLFWSGMVARWADAYYYRMARREIADAVAMYPSDKDAQKAHLTKEGQTSVFGMAGAFAIFGLFLAVIVVQFVPMIAMHQEKQVIFESYQSATAVQKRIAVIYEQTGVCPVGLPFTTDNQKVSMAVVDELDFAKTNCAVVATVSGAKYPVRYLNGRTLTIYHKVDEHGVGSWRCQTSLNKAQTPKLCV